MEEERTEYIILLETIRENIRRNPGLKCWQGIVICNSKEIHWRVTEKRMNCLKGEDK